MGLVAGVDSSTQSCTVALYDEDSGRRLGLAAAPHPPTTPPISEQDPERWWEAFTIALAAACDKVPCSPGAIVAISIAAQHHGLVALDAKHRVLRPAKLWNDTTSAPQARVLVDRFGAGVWLNRTGSVPTAAFTVTKLAWLSEHEPSTFAQLSLAMLPHDWLTMQLTGSATTDRADASGTGYFDAVTNTWCDDILAAIDPQRDWIRQLPIVAAPVALVGVADTARAASIGLSRRTMVAPGTGDQSAAAVGIGLRPGDLLVSLGTAGVTTTLSAKQSTDPFGVVNGTASAVGSFQPVVITLNAAKVTDAFARLLGVGHDELADLALAADPFTAMRPLLLPYLDGERSPDRPYARGVLTGLSSATTREQVALSAFEGVTLGLLEARSALVRSGVELNDHLLATGGAAKSPAFRSVLADIFGQPTLIPKEEDSTVISARGAALQAVALHTRAALDAVSAVWRPDWTVAAEPRTGSADYSRGLSERYRHVKMQTNGLDDMFSIAGISW